MSTTDTEPQVGTYDELDLDVIRRPTRTLTVRGVRYPVAATMTVPMMGMLLDLEQSIRESSIEPDDPGPDASEYERRGYEQKVGESRRQAVGAINAAHDAILEMIRVETPGVHLQFDTQEILAIISWLVRNPQGATGAVVAAVTDAGGSGDPGDDTDPGEATPPGEDGGPLPSAKPSSRRSSGTAGKPSSVPAGGRKRSGTTSGSPSASPAAA